MSWTELMWHPTTLTCLILMAIGSATVRSPDRLPTQLHIHFTSTNPAVLFQSCLLVLVSISLSLKVSTWYGRKAIQQRRRSSRVAPAADAASSATKPKSVSVLQYHFWTVFWLFRIAFWMAGPYAYAAYSSKQTANGQPVSETTISYISLTGYAAIALLGPSAGRISQHYGPKVGSWIGMILYGLGTFSVTSSDITLLFVGKALGGIGQSLLKNGPESWLIQEFKRRHPNEASQQQWLGETFGTAYSMDSVLAIVAGQTASLAASRSGPNGPFVVAPVFLIVSVLIILVCWSSSPPPQATKESKTDANKEILPAEAEAQPTIGEALQLIKEDKKILLLGLVQACYEGAMYIFVLVWPPTTSHIIRTCLGDSVPTPYGMAFSCFMAACMLGSTLFGKITKHFSLEMTVALVVGTAALSLGAAKFTIRFSSTAWVNSSSGVLQLFSLYLLFEATVGVYFPCMGILRCNYLPDSHRAIIMTLYAVPLNVLVVSVFLLFDYLGHSGALAVATFALMIATGLIILLDRQRQLEERRRKAKSTMKRVISKTMWLIQTNNALLAQLPSKSDSGEEEEDSESDSDSCDSEIIFAEMPLLERNSTETFSALNMPQ